MDDITTDTGFSKIIYEYLIKAGSVSGRQLCLILYDQGVLAYDAEEISSLESNAVSPVSFLRIRSRILRSRRHSLLWIHAPVPV